MQQQYITAIVNVTEETFDETVKFIKNGNLSSYSFTAILKIMSMLRIKDIPLYTRLYKEITSKDIILGDISKCKLFRKYEEVKEITDLILKDDVENIQKLCKDKKYYYYGTYLYEIDYPHIAISDIDFSVLCGSRKCFDMFCNNEYYIPCHEIVYMCFDNYIFNKISRKICMCIPDDNFMIYNYVLHNKLTDKKIEKYDIISTSVEAQEEIIKVYFKLQCMESIKEIIDMNNDTLRNIAFKYAVIYYNEEIMKYIIKDVNTTEMIVRTNLLRYIIDNNYWKELLSFALSYIEKGELSDNGFNLLHHMLDSYALNKIPCVNYKEEQIVLYLYDSHKFDINHKVGYYYIFDILNEKVYYESAMTLMRKACNNMSFQNDNLWEDIINYINDDIAYNNAI